MKRTIWKLLAVGLALFVSVGSTIAYLTDEEKAVNVMTLDRVEIDLIEQERNAEGTLVDFQDNHPLAPGVHRNGLTVDEDGYWVDVRNAVDKIVTIKNTGKADAYVRLWFAFEALDGKNFFDEKVHLNKDDSAWDWYYLEDDEGENYRYLYLNDTQYMVAVATYPSVLAPNTTTPVSLRQVLMDSSVTNEDFIKLGDKYNILVVAQGMQTDGFDSATEALNEGFGEPILANHPFEEMKEEDAGNNTGSDFTIYPAEKIDWYTGGIQELLPKGKSFKVYDVETGIVWNAFRWAGSNHAEVEPLTQADTERLCDIYDVDNPQEIVDKNLYQRRPCLVTVGNRTFACSLYGVPHNPDADTIPNNGMDGVLCLFFTNSTNHADSVDKSHEEAIEYAYQNAPNGQKPAESLGYVQITQNGVGLRTRPTSGEVVTRLGIGTVWPIIGPSQESDGYTWYNIKADDYTGYVRGDCAVKLTKEQAEIFEQTGVTPSLPGEEPDNESHVCNYQPTDEYIEVDEESHRRIWICTGCNGEPEFKYEVHTYDNTGKCVCGATESNDAASPVDDFMWEKTEVGDGIAITEYMGTATEVSVPATIDGLPVTSIGSEAFYGCARLTSISLPDSVTYIGERAFGGCTGLTCITIPDSVTSIGNSAFYGCTGLTSITIPDGVTSIEGWVFQFCSSLTSITIPEGVVKIDTGSFYECTNLTRITIPANVTHIADAVFFGCTSLTSIIIPDSVTSIGKNVFNGCDNITVYVPVGSYAEKWCNKYSVRFQPI